MRIPIVVFALFLPAAAAAGESGASLAHHPGRVIVKFREGSAVFAALRAHDVVSPQAAERQAPPISTFLTTHRLTAFHPVKPDAGLAPLPGGIERLFVAPLAPAASVSDAVASLHRSPDVEYAEPDFVGSGGGEPHEVTSTPTVTPNDPEFVRQWGLLNSGQTMGGVPGTAGADINITPAWNITTGSPRTLLTVLDTGIPMTAGEFAGRLVQGYDFVNNDTIPADDQGHGSNTTSIAAAEGNNGSVMAGVNWQCRIQHIKVLDAANRGYYSWWVSGLRLAADSGARVISMSMGGNSSSASLADAVTYAAAAGAVVVACMMNTNNETTYYPAAYSNVIAVGAVNNRGWRAAPFAWGGGSNYGAHIDLVAPGDWILGLSHTNPSSVVYWSGTSQATPMVSGIITLMLALDSTLTFGQIYDLLRTTARDQTGNPAEDSPGWDKYNGWGLVDAHAALLPLADPTDAPLPPLPASLTLLPNYPNPFNPATVVPFEIPAAGHVRLEVWSVLGQLVGTLVDEERAPGKYSVTFDAAGLPSGFYLFRLRWRDAEVTRSAVVLK